MFIAVECNADEALVKALIPEERHDVLRHLKGKGNIFNRLRKESTIKALGLVDQDPGSTQSSEFTNNYDEKQSVGAVRQFVHREKPGVKVLMLCPRLEEWFVDRARVVQLLPERYGLPSTGADLHNRAHYEQEEGFRRFLDDLLSCHDHEVETLRAWLMER